MTRILRIKRSESEDMLTFSDNLEKALEQIGLENIGRLGTWHTAGPRFPSTYGFESTGEGGFIVEYEENHEVCRDISRSGTIKVDAILVPLGATGSLVQRTYEHLKQVSVERGYEASEMKVKSRF
jgi:hypothetical protein